MGLNKTQIESFKNPDGSQGYSWNPITGCLNGCDYCYARKLANTRLRERYLANTNLAGGYHLARGVLNEDAIPPESNPFYPRFWREKLVHVINPVSLKGITRAKPKGIFCCDMSDLFGIGIPEEWTKLVLDTIKLANNHRFYLLTKQAQNLPQWSPFPDNCWMGVTATGYESFYFGATHYLAGIQATIKYISFEPLLEGMGKHIPGWLTACLIDAGIKWVIIGPLTGTYQRLIEIAHKYPNLTLTKSKGTKWTLQPKIEWVQEIVEACDKAGVKVFLKDSLRPLFESYGAPLDFYYKGHIRQEVPQ